MGTWLSLLEEATECLHLSKATYDKRVGHLMCGTFKRRGKQHVLLIQTDEKFYSYFVMSMRREND